MSQSLHPKFLMPLIVFLGIIVIFIRIESVVDSISSGRLFVKPVHAETASIPSAAVSSKDNNPTDTAKNLDSKTPPKNDASIDQQHYAPDDQDRSPAEMEVLNQLSQRREELDKRGLDLDTRESLIKVAEQRVDQKIKEMETLRQQLQSMVNQVSEAQATQIENLVKIYETMKPDEAARIFETLDLPVLLGVIQRMKPTRTAPILAKMAPEKAKEITVALTKQDQLPQIK